MIEQQQSAKNSLNRWCKTKNATLTLSSKQLQQDSTLSSPTVSKLFRTYTCFTSFTIFE